ncbi:hypothetical protein [Kitasatospora sp. Root107]|uniref:hypothetical protein n=1 Tax=Kitasatospora sp. Root107 TaxID=1736424 RepID=UPI0007C7B1A7|nr:hypothetical protein [Kitasatospora sp. Root107]
MSTPLPGRDASRLVYHPAGHDPFLRGVVDDLRAGRWMSTRTLLAATGQNWGVRSSRTQVLGAVAARSDVLDHWALEEPDNPDLLVLRARVAVEGAVAAHRSQSRSAAQLERAARELSWWAASALPEDPVPLLCLLTLAPLDGQQGPWRLFHEALRRHRSGREVHHRMLRYWFELKPWAATDFVNLALLNAPAGSPLLALPLYLSVNQYVRERRKDAVRRQWHLEPHRGRVLTAFQQWSTTGVPWPVVDLSHLAHALWAGSLMKEAAVVFDALSPFAAHQPWSQVADSPDQGEAFLYNARLHAYVGRAHAATRG